MQKEIFLKALYKKAREIHGAIVNEMDVSDTCDWHNEEKYWNADLNMLAVLIRLFYQEVDGVLQEIEEEEEDEE